MSISLESVVFRTDDPVRAAAFWGAVLDRPERRDDRGILLPGSESQIGLRFADGLPHVPFANHLHLHLSEGLRDQQGWIAICERLGGRLRGNGHVPENGYAAMSDPVGDEFCVIEDGNAYLAGCGPLGEVTCSGTREVGLFWSAALGWPLVWESGDETAIQAPTGGTKLAWSGEPVGSGMRRDRQFFALTARAAEITREVDRLIALGASRRDPRSPQTLTDPDGVDFELRALG